MHFKENTQKKKKKKKKIGLIRKLQQLLPTAALLTIYKSFLRSHLDYGDLIYGREFNESFQNKLESVQCNAATQQELSEVPQDRLFTRD